MVMMMMMMMMMMIIIMMLMMIIIIIALKGANRHIFFFYNLLTAPQTVSNTYAQVARAQSSSYHVQHIVCHVVRRDSSAIKFDRAEIAFILTLFYWLKP